MPHGKVSDGPVMRVESLKTRADRLEARIASLEQSVRDDRVRTQRLKEWCKDLEDALERVAGDATPWHLDDHCPRCRRRKPRDGACRFCTTS